MQYWNKINNNCVLIVVHYKVFHLTHEIVLTRTERPGKIKWWGNLINFSVTFVLTTFLFKITYLNSVIKILFFRKISRSLKWIFELLTENPPQCKMTHFCVITPIKKYVLNVMKDWDISAAMNFINVCELIIE